MRRRGQQPSGQLLVRPEKLGHAVKGPGCLAAFGFEGFLHEKGVAMKAGEIMGQRHQLSVEGSNPDLVQIGRASHHAIDDGMGIADALGTKLLHVLIYPCGQPAKFIHGQFKPPKD